MEKAEFNLNILEDKVSTQYGDYLGYIQIDGHSGIDLFTLCEDFGVDMEKYFLLSFGMGESTIDGIGKTGEVLCKVLVIEKEKYGFTFDEIKRNLQNEEGIVNVKESHFSMPYKKLDKYIKRYDFMVSTKISKYVKQILIDEI